MQVDAKMCLAHSFIPILKILYKKQAKFFDRYAGGRRIIGPCSYIYIYILPLYSQCDNRQQRDIHTASALNVDCGREGDVMDWRLNSD